MRVRRRAGEYEAVRWNGDNFAEVEEVIKKYIPENSGPYRDDEEYDVSKYQYDTLQWWCCEDHELDRDYWVVFHVESASADGPDHFCAVLSDEAYWREFESAEA